MKLAAFDIATRTGWCCGGGESIPRHGSRHFPQFKDLGPGAGFFAFEQWVADLIANLKPDVVVFEAPILAGKTQIATTRRLQGMAAIVEKVAYEADCRCFEATLSSVKKYFAGHGRAEKPAMMKAATDRGFDIGNDDEADACAVWLYALSLIDEAAANRFAPGFGTSPLGSAA